MQLRYFNKDKLRSPSPEIQQPISKLLIWNFLINHTKLIILFSKQTRIANFVTIGQIVVSNLEFVVVGSGEHVKMHKNDDRKELLITCFHEFPIPHSDCLKNS